MRLCEFFFVVSRNMTHKYESLVSACIQPFCVVIMAPRHKPPVEDPLEMSFDEEIRTQIIPNLPAAGQLSHDSGLHYILFHSCFSSQILSRTSVKEEVKETCCKSCS